MSADYIKGLESAVANVMPSYNPYGKAGSFARAEAAKATGTLDDKTRKELEAYVNNSAGQFDENVVSKAKELLEYWTPTTIGGGYSSNAQFAYNAQLKAIEEQRKYQEQLAEQARQDAIKNAYITYDRSLPTFGQNAERLAQMGMSNSGYSDYLGGVAYSSMVGGVQDAHKTANEAIERAYYNASQQKAEAADTLYNRQLAESQIAYDREQDKAKIDAETKAAYTSAFSEIIAGAGSGKYDEETARGLAYANGITNEADIQKIINAAKANSVNKNKDDKEKLAAQISIENEIKGIETETGEMYFPTFDELMLTYGDYYTKEELEDFADKSENNKNAYLYGVYASQLTSATTYADIGNLTDISPEHKEQLKKDLDKLIVDTKKSDLATEVSQGNVSVGVIPDIDTRYLNNNLSKGAYQEIYFEKVLACIEGAENVDDLDEVIDFIKDLKIAGKTTEIDAENLIKYANDCKVVQINPSVSVKLQKEVTKHWDSANGSFNINTYKMSFGGDEVDFYIKKHADKKASHDISKKIPNPEEGNIIKYDGKVYVYVKIDNKDGAWYTTSGLEKTFDKFAKYAPATKTKPAYGTQAIIYEGTQGGRVGVYEVEDENGNIKTISTVRGH